MLVHWIASNPDFDVLDRPQPVTVGKGITAVQPSVQVSRTARFGDPKCPPTPAALRSSEARGDLVYSIGGEEVQMLFATVPFDERSSTLVIALDPIDPNDLELQRAARP